MTAPLLTNAMTESLKIGKEALKEIEGNLERELAAYQAAMEQTEIDFHGLVLQLFIFQYDLVSEMVAYVETAPKGFAAQVALSGSILHLFEFNQHLHDRWLPTMAANLVARGVSAPTDELRARAKETRAVLRKLREWQKVRNKVAGHYGLVSEQVEMLLTLREADVVEVLLAFLAYISSLIQLHSKAVRQHTGDQPDALFSSSTTPK